MRIPRILIATALTVAGLTTAGVARADTPNSHQWYTVESTISPADIRGDSDGAIPTDRTYCFVYGLGAKHINVGGTPGTQDFTGLTDTTPVGLGQRGISDTRYGSTACQAKVTATNRWMGFLLNKDSIVADNPIPAAGSIYGMQMLHYWGADTSRHPWADEYGDAATLNVSASYTIVTRSASPGTVQYGQLVLALVDTSAPRSPTHRPVWFTVSLWDSRGTHAETVHPDTAGTPNDIIDTYLQSGLNFVGVGPGSQTFDGLSACSCRFYDATITRPQLVAAMTAVNTAMLAADPTRTPYSLNPNDWAVTLVGGGTEMYSPDGSTGWIGSRLGNLTLTTTY